MFSDNINLTFKPSDDQKDATVDLFKLAGTGVFCGIGGFAYEAAGTIFTGNLLSLVKESMETPLYIKKILIRTFTFIGFLFFSISISFYHVGNTQ